MRVAKACRGRVRPASARAAPRCDLLDCDSVKGGHSMAERRVFRWTYRDLWMTVTVCLVVASLVLLARPLWAQKAQESFRDKFNIAEETGGVAIATSSDGKYVYVAGRNGIIVSDDFGKTGSWVQTVRMKQRGDTSNRPPEAQ